MTTAIATASGAGVLATGSERALGISEHGLRAEWERYRAFRTSVAEPSALDGRQFADAGISPSAIRRQARTAVYGQ